MRKLYYVPNMHDAGESPMEAALENIILAHPKKKRELEFIKSEVARIQGNLDVYWNLVYQELEALGLLNSAENNELMVYMEGVHHDVDVEHATKASAETTHTSLTVKFLKRLISCGARIYGPENAMLFRRHLESIHEFSKKETQMLRGNMHKLVRARDNFIARYLDSNMPNDCVAVLLMGAKHKVPKSLRAIKSDIVVCEIRVVSPIEQVLNNIGDFIDELEKKFKASR